MTDIETLRQAVIDEARIAVWPEWQGRVALYPIKNAVAALDAAMRPDPWKLLEAVAAHDALTKGGAFDTSTSLSIRRALAWREEHPDD